MPKKQIAKKRTQVKTLPKKGKKLSKGDMKNVKGGLVTSEGWDEVPLGVKGKTPKVIK